ncbi:FAD-dependent thymidylate synthase [Ensifer sp. ENS04]|uniref:FAD-dependent thymidylate synthase n=1 Tax=Ensifer sp. ENS04 TaxID=2769281 RepID=UPI0017869258|nr:FAD-dependent thymidylate synthase [Ensifer sp. ENS04]MBD9544220.1 FAD-dependent thymidylate synthase [Ensifer sp. ENS04]
MTITAIVIKDSINTDGQRITTLQLRYPRFIHAEFMTHRVMSRNASSSRAIPVHRLIQDIIDDTAMPMHWGKNQPGMQAREEHTEVVNLPAFDLKPVGSSPQLWTYGELALHGSPSPYRIPATRGVIREAAWIDARDYAIAVARAFDTAGYHKQIVNRLLEPFTHINVVVTATDWDNFFTLRDHPDAQPEIQVLAREIKAAMAASTPIEMGDGDWHLPYVTDEDQASPDDLIKVSVARCARVSYLTHDGRKTTVEEDVELHDRLVVAEPLHASPAEHQATPFGARDKNFNGWRQYRSILETHGVSV